MDRVFFFFFCDSYFEEELKEGEKRVVLKLSPFLSPFKAAVLPLTKKLEEDALNIFRKLSRSFMVDYDDSGSIGKRYRRHIK